MAVLAAPLPLVMAWGGGEWEGTVGTRRGWWGPGEDDGDQEEPMGMKGR